MIRLQTLLKKKQNIFLGFAAGLMALAGAITMFPGRASAGYAQAWVGSGYGAFQWDEGSDYLTIHSDPWTLGAGQCGDAIFDWERNDYNPLNGADHHDARLVRVCQSQGTYDITLNPDTGGSLQGEPVLYEVGSNLV